MKKKWLKGITFFARTSALLHVLQSAFMMSIKVLNSYLMKLRSSRHLPIGFYGCIHRGRMKKKRGGKSITVDSVIQDDELSSHLSRTPEIKETTNRELECWRN